MLGKVLRLLFIAVFIGYLFSMASVYFSYIEPYLFPLRMIQGEARYVTENIIVGPYPHKKDLEKLVKVNDVKVIISLLNPSLPFEKSLLEKEKRLVKEFGLAFYSVPLSYLNLDSPENYRKLELIRKIVEKHRGEKVYIHCYLGRHRVGFVAERLLGVAK